MVLLVAPVVVVFCGEGGCAAASAAAACVGGVGRYLRAPLVVVRVAP